MTMRISQTMRSSGIGFLCGIAALMLAGCVTNPEIREQASVVQVISDRPVQMTVGAEDMREAKTKGTTILVLPNDKLSPAGTNGELVAEEDSGSCSVSHGSRLCLNQIDRYTGSPSCYNVTKLGGRLLLTDKRRTFLYHRIN